MPIDIEDVDVQIEDDDNTPAEPEEPEAPDGPAGDALLARLLNWVGAQRRGRALVD